ncbi:MAG: sigma 54-interacting transcriptional regulator [Candidatus Binatia bacterium]
MRNASAEERGSSSQSRFPAAQVNPSARDRLLLDIANLLTTQLDPEQLFQTIAQVLRHVVAPIERATLALYDAERDEFQVVALALQAQSSAGMGFMVPHKGSRAGKVFDTRQPLFCPSLKDDAAFFEDGHLLQDGMRTSLGVPLIVGSTPIGTFNVDCRCEAGLTDDDVALVVKLADQIAIAVANSRAFQAILQAKARLERENEYLSRAGDSGVTQNLLANCPSLVSSIDRLKTLAKVDATVLITGETGTGKGVLARAIHAWSPRRDRPFVRCDCAALAPTLLESELFGHEKGSFTGALARRIGRFELAEGGTLFLDEVAEIPLEVQPKLFGVLEERQIQRVGSSKSLRVDIRVIAATNRDLKTEVAAGRFRRDLLYRLNVLDVHLPPLRERPEDIPVLAEHFLRRYTQDFGVKVTAISSATLDLMRSYSWPGNIRELGNVMERATLLAAGPVLTIPEHVFANDESFGEQKPKPPPANPTLATQTPSRVLKLADMERHHIRMVLDEAGWRIDGPHGAAKMLGLHPNTLRSRMKRLGIRRPETARRAEHIPAE